MGEQVHAVGIHGLQPQKLSLKQSQPPVDFLAQFVKLDSLGMQLLQLFPEFNVPLAHLNDRLPEGAESLVEVIEILQVDAATVPNSPVLVVYGVLNVASEEVALELHR